MAAKPPQRANPGHTAAPWKKVSSFGQRASARVFVHGALRLAVGVALRSMVARVFIQTWSTSIPGICISGKEMHSELTPVASKLYCLPEQSELVSLPPPSPL